MLKQIVFLLMVVTSSASMSTFDFAQNASIKICNDEKVFFKWEYGGAIILDALYSLNEAFTLNYLGPFNTYLDRFKTDPKSNPYGYKLLHNTSIPFDNAVGDGIGLFPINYLTRAIAYPNSNETATDMEIVNKVADQYLKSWPYRLPDGTFSRHHGWEGETDKNASFLWGDDQYMGLTLLARLAVAKKDVKMAGFVAKQALQFAEYMMDKSDGLFFHGYNHADKKTSCCKWGRANGWGMIAHIEVLEMLTALKDIVPPRLITEMTSVLEQHTKGILNTQSEDGRWHQVLTSKDTFLETSATAMFLSSLCRGVLAGWLPVSPEMDASINKAWEGLQKTLQKDGSITGICMGTGIQTNVDAYNKRPTLYVLSSPGLGSVLYAVRDYHKYTNKYAHM